MTVEEFNKRRELIRHDIVEAALSLDALISDAYDLLHSNDPSLQVELMYASDDLWAVAGDVAVAKLGDVFDME